MKNKGFTLIELIIVMAIIGIFAAVIIPSYGKFVKRNRADAALTADTAEISVIHYDSIATMVEEFPKLKRSFRHMMSDQQITFAENRELVAEYEVLKKEKALARIKAAN